MTTNTRLQGSLKEFGLVEVLQMMELGGGAAEKNDASAFAYEAECCGAAYAASRAGYNGNTIFDAHTNHYSI